MKDEFQSVFVELSNGAIGVFQGPVLVKSEDKELSVVGVKFTIPRELPDGLTWEKLKNEQT